MPATTTLARALRRVRQKAPTPSHPGSTTVNSFVTDVPPPPKPEFAFVGHEREFAAQQQRRIPIWRYMDLAKFVSMLSTRALYFTRADHFADPFEGSITRARLEARLAFYRAQKRRGQARRLTSHEGVFVEDHILNTAINCWHANEYESFAMWKLYAVEGIGVAVRSTYDRLASSLPRADRHRNQSGPWMLELPVRIAKVRYVDYDKYDGAHEDPFLLKRKSFEHEREIRAIAEDWHSFQGDPRDHLPPEYRSRYPDGGALVPVDLAKLIEAVYVPPQAPRWFARVVEDLVKRYRIKVLVRQSALDKDPLH